MDEENKDGTQAETNETPDQNKELQLQNEALKESLAELSATVKELQKQLDDTKKLNYKLTMTNANASAHDGFDKTLLKAMGRKVE